MTISDAFAWLATPDHRLMRRVNRWEPPRWFRRWLIGATRCGDGWLWGFCGVLLLCRFDRVAYIAFTAAATACLTGIAVFETIKHLVGRPRPCSLEPSCWSDLAPPDRFSFPSGHTITAFAVSIPIGLSYEAAMVPLVFVACNVALSRIMLGMHFLSDVIAGAVIGTLLGYGSYLLILDVL